MGWRKPERAWRDKAGEVASARARREVRSVFGSVLLTLACLALLTAPAERAWAAGPNGQKALAYRFGVFPYLPALSIDRIFGPIAASFAAELGRPVYLKTRSTFESFAEQIKQQAYDIIFFYVQAADRFGYLPLARLEGQLSAVALVREDRPWQQWSDLAGKVVATPPALAAVSELAKLGLVDAGLVPGIDTLLRHYGTKTSCLQAVSIGAADACVLPGFVLPQMRANGAVKLRVLAETPAINHLVFATHQRLPGPDRGKLLGAMLSWPDSAHGRAILAAGAWPRLVPARDADYAQVRDYNARLRVLAER